MRQTACRAVLALALSLAASLTAAAAVAQGNLRIGLDDDPDVLDPTLSRTYTPASSLSRSCGRPAAEIGGLVAGDQVSLL